MLEKLEIYGRATVFAVVAALGFGAYQKHRGETEERARWEAKEAAATKADLISLTSAVQNANQIAKDAQTAAAAKVQQRVIDRGVIDHVISTNTVYADACFDADGLRAWNDVSAGRALVPGSTPGLKLAPALSTGSGASGTGQQGRNPAPIPPGR